MRWIQLWGRLNILWHCLWDLGLIPRLERPPGEGNGNPLQYSCLENSMDRGAWQVTTHSVGELDMTEQLSPFTFFGIGMKTDLFQSWGHCWVFKIYWDIEYGTFTAPSFRIWNSSAGIPSPPLALFTVMLPKAYLTSHSRMSGSRWVITPSWLSGS